VNEHELTNDHFKPSVFEDDAGFPLVTIEGANGIQHGPVPLVGFDTHAIFCRRMKRFCQPINVRCYTPIQNGLHLEPDDKWSQITVGVVLKLVDDRLRFTFKMAELCEREDQTHRLCNGHLLPGPMTVGREGEVPLPMGTDAMFSPADAPAMTDGFLIYGEQPRWELLPMQPVASIGENGNDIVAVATECPEDAIVRFRTDGNGAGGIDMGACLREHWIDPVDGMDRSIGFVPAAFEIDQFHTNARTLRRHIVDDLNVKPISEQVKESPAVEQLTRSITGKAFYGVLDEGHGLDRRRLCGLRRQSALPELSPRTRWSPARSRGGVERVLKAVARTYGGVTTECEFLYATRHCAAVCMPGDHRNIGRPLERHQSLRLNLKRVPLSFLAVSGLIMSYKRFSSKNRKAASVDVLLMGMLPHHGDTVAQDRQQGGQQHSGFEAALAKSMKIVYDQVRVKYCQLKAKQILGWRRHDDGTEASAVGDGTMVRSDIRYETVNGDGEEVRFS
jgi:hypothetical protein